MLSVCVRDVMDIVFSVCIVDCHMSLTNPGPETVEETFRRHDMTTICRSDDLTVPPLVCCYGKYKCLVMQILYDCVHHVAVLNAAFCMTCSLLMLDEDERGDQMEEAYSRAGLMTAFYVAVTDSFYLPHPVAVALVLL